MSRWQEDCLGHCEDCIASATVCTYPNQFRNEDSSYKRFMTVGTVRYGMRVGAVSPPPPGAGPRYRSQRCWPATPCGSGDGVCDELLVPRIPLLNTPPINSTDIISCANRMRMNENATSNKLSAQQASAVVRDHVLYSGKCLLKTQLKHCALVKPQVYTRLTEYGDARSHKENNTLDRLPRFRFGGNRTAAGDKRSNDQRYRDLTDRLKRGTVPVPPPRTRHSLKVSSPSPPLSQEPTPDCSERLPPFRSASFSCFDYSSDDNKHVRKRAVVNDASVHDSAATKEVHTFPRLKTISRTTLTTDSTLPLRKSPITVSDTPQKDQIYAVVDLHEEPPTPVKELSKEIPEAEVTSELLQSPQPRPQENLASNQEKKRDKSKRRKGIYLSQWPNTYQSSEDVIPQLVEDEDLSSVEITTKLFQDSLTEISKFQAQEDKTKDFPIWSSPQEEPLSPDENNVAPEWTVPNNSRPRFLSQSPDDKEFSKNIPKSIVLFRSDSLSEGEPDLGEQKSDQISLVASDVSDCECRLSVTTEPTSPNVPRRYSKRPLRGPYGQMLEAEMKKPEVRKNLTTDLKFLEDLSSTSNTSMHNLSKARHKSRGSCNSSSDETNSAREYKADSTHLHSPKHVNKRKVSADNLIVSNEIDKKITVSHQRTTSSPSKLEGLSNTEVGSELLEALLRGSSEQLAAADASQLQKDTRTHVVVELYDNERSYVESLEIIVTKYLEPLKASENAHLLDANLADEIFYQIPFLLSHHQAFLGELKKRLEHWDIKQKIGDVLLDMFSKTIVIESYTNYVNNWKRARDILKSVQQSKPAFSRFLEITARQHTGKLALDSLLIKPIQKFPKYELLLQRLIKHTDEAHPDHNLLLAAQKQVHEQLLKINCTEKEALELEQLREIEGIIDGLVELAIPERQYLRHDSVSMSYNGGPRKERALFLFSDLLLITGIKRRSGTIRRPTAGQGSVTSTLEANKYKLLMRISLGEIEIVRTRDDNVRQMMIEIDNLSEDISVLNQMSELAWTLHYHHSQLDEVIKDMLLSLNRQLSEQQNCDSQLSCLDLTVSTSNGLENLSIVFSKTEKKTSWEETMNEAKQKLALSVDKKPSPKLLATVPIRKTRAGLQFTCAAPTLAENGKDVWVCNSDGYVGQVCVLSLTPEPTVTSCNGVCNARITCIASVPGVNSGASSSAPSNKSGDEAVELETLHFDSSSSSDEDENYDSEHNEDPQRTVDSEACNIENDEADSHQSTVWLGTEDGCIHVYNSGDNIRIKKNKIKQQLGAAVLCIIYLDKRVFVSLANGEVNLYDRDSSGGWYMQSHTTYCLGTTNSPVSKMVTNAGKLWCVCGGSIKIINTQTLAVENSFSVNNENKLITCIALSGNGAWVTLQNSALLRCYHALTFDLLCEVNVAPAVTKMLTSCDDIIRQHKAACLRVTALVTSKDLLWVGTSAGVLLTVSLPHISTNTTKLSNVPAVSGVPQGHTGHVRFLTSVEMTVINDMHRNSYKAKQDQRSTRKLLVISGGDGYEDFRTSNLSEVAGREDSTNHLLMWSI